MPEASQQSTAGLRPADSGVVLGIDPGTHVVGYGAVRRLGRDYQLVEAGVVRVSRTRGLPERLGRIAAELEALIESVAPAVVVVESSYFGRNPASALRLGEGRGVALATAARSGARVVEIAPASAKRALVGNGRAEKEQVARMVAVHLGLARADGPLDATDALSLALAHLMAGEDPRERIAGASRGRQSGAPN